MTTVVATMRTTAVIAALALGLAAAAHASSIGVTSTVAAGGAVSVAAGTAPSFAVTLNGVDQTPTYVLPTIVTDATGSGTGWNLTVTSTVLSDGKGHSLPATASTITGVSAVCEAGSTCTLPTNAIVDTNLALPAAVTAPTAVKLYNAAASTGLGRIDVNATVAVKVPANVLAGTYSSTVSLAIVSGP